MGSKTLNRDISLAEVYQKVAYILPLEVLAIAGTLVWSSSLQWTETRPRLLSISSDLEHNLHIRPQAHSLSPTVPLRQPSSSPQVMPPSHPNRRTLPARSTRSSRPFPSTALRSRSTKPRSYSQRRWHRLQRMRPTRPGRTSVTQGLGR